MQSGILSQLALTLACRRIACVVRKPCAHTLTSTVLGLELGSARRIRSGRCGSTHLALTAGWSLRWLLD